MGAAASGRAPRNEDDSESEDATEKVAKSMAITRIVKAAMVPTKLAKVQPTQLLYRKKTTEAANQRKLPPPVLYVIIKV
jgi:hypothetical protein